MDLLHRIRWANVARAAPLAAAVLLVVAWPKLRAEPPPLPPEPEVVERAPAPEMLEPVERRARVERVETRPRAERRPRTKRRPRVGRRIARRRQRPAVRAPVVAARPTPLPARRMWVPPARTEFGFEGP